MTVSFHDPTGRFWIGDKYRGISGLPATTPIPSPVALVGFAAGLWLVCPSILCGQRCCGKWAGFSAPSEGYYRISNSLSWSLRSDAVVLWKDGTSSRMSPSWPPV